MVIRRILIATGFAIGVVVTALVTCGLLAVAGRLHSRKLKSRSAHPSMRSDVAGKAPVATEIEPDDSIAEADDSAAVPERRHVTAHRGLPEMIHALGPEIQPGRKESSDIRPVSLVYELPSRFDRYVGSSGFIDLEQLLLDVLSNTAYEVRPVRGDLIATRGSERLLLRALPWDGSHATVGSRTAERFAADFARSGATDGICFSEAAMPNAAAAIEADNQSLWFVGRTRLVRFLESLDGALAFSATPQTANESDHKS